MLISFQPSADESRRRLVVFWPRSSRVACYRWRKRPDAPGLPLIVDFLAAKTEDTAVSPDGSIEPVSELVASNLGVRLTPFAIRAGHLVDEDAETLTVENVDLLYHRAVADVDVRYAGPSGS
jgi:hypothetical protein